MLKLLKTIALLSLSSTLAGNTYYVATNGSDSNPGTLSSPWRTWQKAFNVAVAGDVVYIRGGIYYYTGTSNGGVYGGVSVEAKHGTSSNKIVIQAYSNEVPILDGSNMTVDAYRRGITLANCSYYVLKGLTIRNVKESGGASYTATPLSLINCRYITVEKCTVSGSGNGFSTSGFCDYIDFINCDAYNNADYSDNGGFANGFTLTMYQSPGVYASGTHVTLSGCRAWGNSDDGFDMYGANGYFKYTNCWAFNNGWGGGGEGNGDGFKSQQFGPPESGVQRTYLNCLASGNRGQGFTAHPKGSSSTGIHYLYNCVSYNNSSNGIAYSISDGGTPSCIFRNNISYDNGGLQYSGLSGFIEDHNSWDGKVSVSSGDFISLDQSVLTGSRKSDGSLPDVNYLKLASGSDLIDAGVNVGLPYNGSNPDIGYFESGSTSNISIPVLSGASVNNSTPSILELTYDLNLASVVPPASAFTVNINSGTRSINSVAVSGTKVSLTLSSPVSFGDVVTVSYSAPSTNAIATPSGGKAASFTNHSVSNNLGAPSPVYVSSIIRDPSPAWLEITFNTSLANILPAVSSFVVTVNSVPVSIRYVLISGVKACLALTNSVAYNDVLTVAYTKPGSNPLQSAEGGQVNSFAAQKVTNTLSPPSPVYVSSVIQNSTPAKLDITFNLALSNSVPSAGAFAVSVNSAARSVNSVAISGTVVTLTLSSPVAFGEAVTVAYTEPSSSPLQATTGAKVATFASQKVTNNVGPVVPVLISASVENAAPTKLILTYNLNLAGNNPPASSFAVTVNSVSRAVTAVAVSGAKVTLTLASAAANGNTIKVSYTKPTSNPVQTPAGGQAASFAGQTVTNNILVNNNPPVVMVNYHSEAYSGFVEELNASGSYDVNNDKLTFSWVVPGNISVSSKSGSSIEYLSPVTDVKRTVQFVVNVSDGKTVQSKTIPVEILPFEPGLDIAEIVNVEASTFSESNFPANIIDGNIGTIWAADGDNQWLLLTLRDPFSVQHVKLAFQPGQKFESYFDILGSEDLVTWEQILTKSNSCDFSGDLQVFEFPATKASKEFKYIKLIGHGNAANTWNYLSEFRIFGYKHKNPTSYEEQPVKIFPNPAHDYFNVKIEETSMVHDYLRIVSMTGSILYQGKIDPGVSEFQVPINLLKGIYLVQIGSKNITLFSQKLVVSK